jgi:LSD1 subclass zinc finger protein
LAETVLLQLEGGIVPVVNCPQCATRLKIPDGASGNVKCPKCAAIFAVTASSPPPAFEVVEDDPPASPPPPPARRPATAPAFEVVDEPPPKKKRIVVTDEEDEEDRPRKRPRRDDDEEDEEDRPRKRPRRDDDDDEYDRRPSGNRSAYGAAKVGMLLVSISLWLYLGTFALLAFFLLIAWMGASIPNGLMILTGLLGLGNWVVALIGLGFSIAGPSKSRGLAIAATAVAAVHLVMAFVVANNTKAGFFGFHTIPALSMLNKFERATDIMKKMERETDPKRLEALQRELQDLSEDGDRRIGNVRPGSRTESDMRWSDLSTLMPYSDQFIGVLSYQSKAFSNYVLPLLSGLLEVARLVLLVLLIGAVGKAVKDYDAGEKSLMATFIAGGAALAAMVVVVLVMVILDNSKPATPKSLEEAQKSAKGQMTWSILGELLVYAIHIGSLVLPALLALKVSSSARRR